MVVSFNIGDEARLAFDSFYHGQFLPSLFKLSPQLRAIKRYNFFQRKSLLSMDQNSVAESDSASESVEPKSLFATVYELDCEETLANTDAIFGSIDFAPLLAKFREYKESFLTDFSRLNYRQLAGLRRQSRGSELTKIGPTSLCVLSFILNGKEEEQFLHWYLGQYQALIFSDMDQIYSCRTYQSISDGTSEILTFFEILDPNLLDLLQERIRNLLIETDSPFLSSVQAGAVLRPILSAALPIFALP